MNDIPKQVGRIVLMVAAVLQCQAFIAHGQAGKKPNVLFTAVDDLNVIHFMIDDAGTQRQAPFSIPFCL